VSDVVDAIRASIAPGASAEERAAGAAACRALAAKLDPAGAPQPPIIAPELVQQLVGVLRTMDIDQVLDIAIAKLGTVGSKQGAPALPAARPFAIRMVPVPRDPR
jgi:hypothetical protein